MTLIREATTIGIIFLGIGKLIQTFLTKIPKKLNKNYRFEILLFCCGFIFYLITEYIGINFSRTFAYDILFHESIPISTQWGFYEILKKLPKNSTVLDVGIGSCIYLKNQKVIKLIKDKNIKIHGIDIDERAIPVCKERISKNKLEKYVSVQIMDLLDVTKKYDYVTFLESFPVISNELFIKFIKHAQNITNKHILLYHNLIQDQEYSFLFHIFKNYILHYITFNDFGKLTTVSKMKNILTQQSKIDPDKISMKVLIKSTYKEIIPLFNYIPYYGNKEIKQYLITISK